MVGSSLAHVCTCREREKKKAVSISVTSQTRGCLQDIFALLLSRAREPRITLSNGDILSRAGEGIGERAFLVRDAEELLRGSSTWHARTRARLVVSRRRL